MSRKNVKEQFVGVRMLSKRFKALQFTAEQDETIRVLIANMVVTDDDIKRGVDSRWGEQSSYKLNPDYLPKAMDFERDVVRLMERMHRDGVPATRERLLMSLKLSYGDKAEKRFDELYAWRNAA